MDKVDGTLGKVDALTIGAIGANVRALSGNLRRLTGSPQLTDSLNHPDRTLATLDRTTQAAAPKIGPTLDPLKLAASDARAAAAAASRTLGDGGGAQDADLPAAIRQLA